MLTTVPKILRSGFQSLFPHIRETTLTPYQIPLLDLLPRSITAAHFYHVHPETKGMCIMLGL